MLNGNYLSISFEKVAISLAFLTLKNFELLQNVGILRVLKNRELQIREIQDRELQGLPVVVSMKRVGFFANCEQREVFKKPRIANPRNTKPRIARTPCKSNKSQFKVSFKLADFYFTSEIFLFY